MSMKINPTIFPPPQTTKSEFKNLHNPLSSPISISTPNPSIPSAISPTHRGYDRKEHSSVEVVDSFTSYIGVTAISVLNDPPPLTKHCLKKQNMPCAPAVEKENNDKLGGKKEYTYSVIIIIIIIIMRREPE